jgi:hypothetical protein
MDDFISCIISTSKQQIKHVARIILHGIHDVFPPSADNERDPISLKKLQKGNGTHDTTKCLLGFEFNSFKKNNVAGGNKKGNTTHYPLSVDSRGN